MKKVLSLLLAAATAGLCLIACSPKSTTNGPTDPNPSSEPTDGGDDSTDGGDDSTGVDTAVKLTFDTGDGAFVDGQTSFEIEAGGNTSAVVAKGNPRKDAYAFSGWYNGEVKFDPETTYSSAQTFTARYVSGANATVYEALFDTDTTVKVKIDMSDAEWKKLNADYLRNTKSPIYRKADCVEIAVTTDEELVYTYEEVGIRMKGNTSRREFYGDDGFFATVHYKMSFGETFDDEEEYEPAERKEWTDTNARKARKNRTIGTMEKLDLKYNKNVDETYSKDIYAMKMFRDNGILAPQATLCGVSAKNKDASYINLGVYMLYECVGSDFLERHMPDDAEGDLYKCSFTNKGPADFTNGLDTIGIEDELNGEFYSYDKKTNKKKKIAGTNELDFTSMSNFISAVGSGSTDFESVIDTDYFARFEAVNYLLGNPDCIRNNSNNFYTYFRSDGKAIFIPYDYDRCFGITKDWDPTAGTANGPACTGLAPFTRQSAARGNQTNPLYVNLIDKGAPTGEGSTLQKYRTYLLSLAQSSAFTNSTFNAFVEKYSSKYSATASTAINTNNTRFGATDTGNLSFSDYISAKLNTLEQNKDNYSI